MWLFPRITHVFVYPRITQLRYSKLPGLSALSTFVIAKAPPWTIVHLEDDEVLANDKNA